MIFTIFNPSPPKKKNPIELQKKWEGRLTMIKTVSITFPCHSYTDVIPGIILTQAASLPLSIEQKFNF